MKHHNPIHILLLLIPMMSWANSHHPTEFLKKIAGSPDEGKQIVEHYCATCHAKHPMISMGAPRIGMTEDWTSRLENGLSGLFKHTETGLRAMPARGGCFECSDAQLQMAIEAMLSKEHLKQHKQVTRPARL